MKHVIIIGAGFAGAAAAVACVDAGLRVTVLESLDRLGGRASSFDDATAGVELDNGQHLLSGAYHTTFALLRRLGTDGLLKPQSHFGVTFVHPGGVRTHVGAMRGIPGIAGLLLGVLTSSHLSLWERVALVRGMNSMRTLASDTVQQFNISQLLDNLRQPKSLQQKFWSPFVLAVMNNTPGDAAASLLVETVHRAFFGSKGSANLILPTVGLSHLLAPLPAVLKEAGSQVRLGGSDGSVGSVGSIEFEGDHASGVKLISGEFIPCDAVISAVPPHRLAPLLQRMPASSSLIYLLATFQYSPIITCYLGLDRTVMTEAFLGSTSTRTQWIFNRSLMLNRSGIGQELALVISAAPDLLDLSVDEIRDRCLKDLRLLIPEANDASVNWVKVIKEKRATFVCSSAMERLRPGPVTAIANMFLAGDWTNTHLPATIESASISGYAAAEHAVRHLRD